MATWIGLFVNNIDGGSVRVLKVSATSETEALNKLDFYDYDQTWQNFSFMELYQEKQYFSTLIVHFQQVVVNYLELIISLGSRKYREWDSSK